MQLTPGKMTIPKGTVIAEIGQVLEAVIIVLSGKIWLQQGCFQMVKGQATCIGLNDIDKRSHSFRCVTVEDSVIFVLPLTEKDPVHAMIEKKDDYRAIFVSSQYKSVAELWKIHESLSVLTKKFSYSVPSLYESYLNLYAQAEMEPLAISSLNHIAEYVPNHELDDDELHFCVEASKLPLDVHRSYYSRSEDMALYQIQKLSEMIGMLVSEIKSRVDYANQMMQLLIFKEDSNLYSCALLLGKELRKQGKSVEQWAKLMFDAIDKMSDLMQMILKICGKKLPVDIEEMKKTVSDLSAKELTDEERNKKEEEELDIQKKLLLLQNSLQQIIEFSEHDRNDLKGFLEGMEYFIHASDKLSYDDRMKLHKRNITNKFFELYQECYFKRRAGENLPIAVRLFLDYGYMDEHLLSKDQLSLLCFERELVEEEEGSHIYTMCEWLDAIYEGKKEPSKNEFDEDFTEYIKNLKTQGELQVDEKVALKDMEWRVRFEIDNMFRMNDRICYGQISTYVPVLFQDVMYGYMDKMLLTSSQIRESMKKVEEVDYSLFYRECLTSYMEVSVYHFPLPVKTYPDIILIPGYGVNGSMWQEISGKDKRSPGRILIPAIFGGEIEDTMLKMLGRFRWELCRCVMGMEWNDIRTKSLTSEYMDYMQFYRENRELSEDAKDKMKLQIQKARNNSREFFLLDYENYIKKEYRGTMKLNKISREIISTYVPFKKEVREKLKQQKPYEVAIARYERNHSKRVQEINSLMRAFANKKKPIPEEVMEAYHYYSE